MDARQVEVERSYQRLTAHPADGPLLPPEIEDVFYQAMDLLSLHPPEKVEQSKGRDKALRDEFIDVATVLGDFNSGVIGPGACSKDGL